MKPQMIAAAAGLLLALTACSTSSSEDPTAVVAGDGAADSPTASPSASVAAAPSTSPTPTPTATPTPSASSSTVKPKPANKSATTAAEPAPAGPVAVEADRFRLSDLPAGHYGFASPSGNIKCVATSGSVNCEMSTVQWMSAEAREACDGVGELAGLSMIRSQRPTLRCAGGPLFESLPPTLEYGQKITVAPFACLSQTTSMTCTDTGTGHSFSGARAGYTMR